MKKYIFTILILTLCILSSCKSSRHIASQSDGGQPTVTRPEQERLDVILNSQVKSLTENFSCTVEGIRVNGQIRMMTDSVIWVSVNKIIEVGRLKLTPTRVQAHIKIGGKRYDGDYAGLARQWGIDIDFATVQALLLGNCPNGCTLRDEPVRKNSNVTLNFKRGQQQQITVTKDYPSNLISSISVGNGNQLISTIYSNRINIEGQHLPSTIDARIQSNFLNEETRVSLEKIQINKSVTFPF